LNQFSVCVCFIFGSAFCVLRSAKHNFLKLRNGNFFDDEP
jgi:hypothetical protein